MLILTAPRVEAKRNSGPLRPLPSSYPTRSFLRKVGRNDPRPTAFSTLKRSALGVGNITHHNNTLLQFKVFRPTAARYAEQLSLLQQAACAACSAMPPTRRVTGMFFFLREDFPSPAVLVWAGRQGTKQGLGKGQDRSAFHQRYIASCRVFYFRWIKRFFGVPEVFFELVDGWKTPSPRNFEDVTQEVYFFVIAVRERRKRGTKFPLCFGRGGVDVHLLGGVVHPWCSRSMTTLL